MTEISAVIEILVTPETNVARWFSVKSDSSRLGKVLLDSRIHLHIQIETMSGQMHRDIILKQHLRLFRGAMSKKFVFVKDNTHLYQVKHCPGCRRSTCLLVPGGSKFITRKHNYVQLIQALRDPGHPPMPPMAKPALRHSMSHMLD
ncbi:hypothetical protein TNCV_210481 [Trichonephila clavipes]|uniref:Uncharacterized protein n=1 Tax=Trichonephila clavipes TaxID=2585209 RepID=A0A8X6SYC3_TRICX|nr:hypothetical protein TNCV_210481 [Trichonephila clavipes]